MNYFSLFNLPQQFELDSTVLKSNYQTLQKITHPDRYATSTDQEKRIYMQKNSQINDAYTVLNHPLSRAEHLLELRGVMLANEQETVGNVEFLMQQMELREVLENANTVSELTGLHKENLDSINQQSNELSVLLSENSEQSNQQAANKLREMKFLFKLSEEISTKLDAIPA